MKCLVNVKGYVRLTGFDEIVNGQILPFVIQDSMGVYVINDYGNVVHINNGTYEIL